MKPIYIISLIFVLSATLDAQIESSLYGFSGLIGIPTAEIASDGQIIVGTGYFPHPYGMVEGVYKDNQIYYATMGYLPFLELTVGTVRIVGEQWGIGDRTGSFRVKILNEKRLVPQTAIGFHDPFGVFAQGWAQHLTALYLVSTKSMNLAPVRFRGHLGYGVDWLKAAHYSLLGFFGGADVRYSILSLMAEYDSRYFNYGARLSLFSHFNFLLTWLDGKEMTWGFNVTFKI
jgi:hypothetical protein